ncbi:MAG: tRNA/rRNA [Geobacteraceae bacterium]|nr:MAG: tRNA/rRNA [Geobacteraceae bacterium]
MALESFQEQIKDQIAIVLVEPQSPGNIGMVCRAMKNMGLSELRLVNPCPIDHPEAYKFAVSARDLLERAVVFDTLAEALADSGISVATTRRHGKYRQEIFTPAEVVAKLRSNLGNNRAALVFGREDSGLTTDELALCRWHATIPTGDDYGSLNLAQAVLIFCYELRKGWERGVVAQSRIIADAAETETLYGHMEQTLLRIGFLNPQNPAHIMRSLRRIFARAELDEREVAILRGMLTQIDWAATAFQGKKGS